MLLTHKEKCEIRIYSSYSGLRNLSSSNDKKDPTSDEIYRVCYHTSFHLNKSVNLGHLDAMLLPLA